MTLRIFTWQWGSKYDGRYLARQGMALARNVAGPYRRQIVTPQAADQHLVEAPGCFARLRMFDPDWQAAFGLSPGDRMVCLDLDLVVTGLLDELFDRPEPFVILQGANASNPCPYNGSVWMLQAGYRPDVWTDFSLEAAAAVPHDAFPDDQAWMAHKLPDAAGWKAGAESGIYAFQKPGWPKGEALPAGARIVAFPGWRDPLKFTHLDWVREHWGT